MNKYSIITVVAIIVIVIPVLYGIWNIVSVDQIEFRTNEDTFRYFEMARNEKIELCNPNPFFVSFNGLRIDTYYREDIQGSWMMDSKTLSPGTSEELDIDFSSDSFSETQYLFMHMDGQFTGEQIIRIDPREMTVVTTFDTRIIGVIPYQVSITQSGFEFTQMMNEDSSCNSNN